MQIADHVFRVGGMGCGVQGIVFCEGMGRLGGIGDLYVFVVGTRMYDMSFRRLLVSR